MREVAAPHQMQKSVTELGNIELKRVREIYLKVYDSIRMSCPLPILYRVGSLFGHVWCIPLILAFDHVVIHL